MAALAVSLSACASGGKKAAYRDPVELSAPVPREPSAIDTIRAMAPAEGLKFTPLFTQPLMSDRARIGRLESHVQDLRNDVDTLAPAVLQLQEQVKRLSGGAPVPVAKAPEPIPSLDAPAAAPVKAVVMNGTTVKALRIGDHKDKTRVVLDVTTKPAYKVSMAEDGRQLVVALPGAEWPIQKTWEAKDGDLISHYAYGDETVYLALMSKSKILSQSVIPGEGGHGYRLVIDIARLKPL